MSGAVAVFTVLLMLPAPKSDVPATQPPGIRKALADIDFGSIAVATREQTTAPQASAPKPQRSLGRRIAGGALGAVGGAIAGTYVVGLMMKDPSQPPPLPQGLIIGAPIGAIFGAALGARYF